jgi:fatty-acyl-CoA synthase
MNLSRIIEHWAQMTPNKTAFHFEGADFTYASLWQRVLLATAKLSALGVARGDRVSYLGLNHPDFITLLMACARLGAMVVPLNFRLSPKELAAIISIAEPALLFADMAMQAHAQASLDEVKRTATTSKPALNAFSSLCNRPETPDSRASSADAPASVVGTDEDDVLIVFTSGTTGVPKGAVHTQAALLWNMQSAIASQDLAHHDHLLLSLPMFHVGGLCIQTLPLLSLGATITLHARVDPGLWLHDVAARQPSISLLVPAVLRAVIEHPEFAQTPLDSLKRLNCGSSVVPHALIRAMHARGVPVMQVYGATETGPVSIALRSQDAMEHVGSCGKAALHVEVRLTRDGQDVASGETGEVWLRAKNLMRGYWRAPEGTGFIDGWFATGDLAQRDAQGFYTIVGRSKDLIISGGENIYPAELENLLADFKEIAECAVIGVPDAKWGEVVLAALVRAPGARLEEADVLGFFKDRIAKYKHPRRIVFVESLPKTALGKVQKEVLRETLKAMPNITH